MGKMPVRVLQVLIGGKTFSGVASYLYQYYKHMDHEQVHFDFMFCRENSMELVMDDSDFKESNFYVLNAVKGKSNDYRAITLGLRKILQENEYDVVVVNTSIIAVIYSCMLAVSGKKKTVFIAHAHNTDLILGKNSLRKKLGFVVSVADSIMRRRIREKSDYLFACSEEAAKVTFGSNAIRESRYRLVRNGIDTNRFIYNQRVRASIRKEMNTADTTCVFGNVGSFCRRKNQLFLLAVFKEILEQRPDSELWLVGDGADKEKILIAISEMGLSKRVKLLGQRNDVNDVMQGMDYFVFPTLSEGLGIVAIEAQAAGLFTVVSDGVPKDVLITNHVIQLKLSEDAKTWAKTIMRCQISQRGISSAEMIKDAGYEIKTESKRMCHFLVEVSGKSGEKE